MEDVSSEGDGEDAREGGPVLFEPGDAERSGVESSDMRLRIVRVLFGVMSEVTVLLVAKPLRTGCDRSGVCGCVIGTVWTTVETVMDTAGRFCVRAAMDFDFESFCLVRKSIFSTARSR